jgi:GT2 family glycosyltransferase
VPRLRQFDPLDDHQLTDRELRRRWEAFHGSIHMAQGVWWRRTLGRMLGVNTLRYRAARVVGRPILKLARALLHREKVVLPDEITAVAAVDEHRAFPINYHPQPLIALGVDLTDDHEIDDVAVLVVDETATSPAIASLNDQITSTHATWVAIVDASTTPLERRAALGVLLARAEAGDDVVYADEAGPRAEAPILKSPAVGAHSLLSYNVVGRPALIRRDALARLGGFATDAGWAFEHDAYLRLHEADARFRHVAQVLPAGRPASSFRAEHLNDDTVTIVRAALARRGWGDDVTARATPGVVDWRPSVPAPAPSIDVIIPTRDRLDLVRQCLGAIEAITTYPNFDVIILDNDSAQPETLEFFASTRYRVVPCPGPFNYAAIVNRGVAHSSADFIVTLNNDTIVITPDWLERMVALAALDDVSFVGACLLDRDGTREHESIVIAPYPQHLRTDSNYPHDDQFCVATRDVAAVTGAVQMVRRATWNELGGMDEQLKVVMNDVDICLRSQDEHRYVVYTPDVRLYHHVSSSRGTLDPLDDRNRFIRRWDIFGTFRDPFFPESLLLLGETMYYRHREIDHGPRGPEPLL